MENEKCIPTGGRWNVLSGNKTIAEFADARHAVMFAAGKPVNHGSEWFENGIPENHGPEAKKRNNARTRIIAALCALAVLAGLGFPALFKACVPTGENVARARARRAEKELDYARERAAAAVFKKWNGEMLFETRKGMTESGRMEFARGIVGNITEALDEAGMPALAGEPSGEDMEFAAKFVDAAISNKAGIAEIAGALAVFQASPEFFRTAVGQVNPEMQNLTKN